MRQRFPSKEPRPAKMPPRSMPATAPPDAFPSIVLRRRLGAGRSTRTTPPPSSSPRRASSSFARIAARRTSSSGTRASCGRSLTRCLRREEEEGGTRQWLVSSDRYGACAPLRRVACFVCSRSCCMLALAPLWGRVESRQLSTAWRQCLTCELALTSSSYPRPRCFRVNRE